MFAITTSGEGEHAPMIGTWVRVFTLEGEYLGLGMLKQYYYFYIPELDREVYVPTIKLITGELMTGIDFWWREWNEGETEEDVRRIIEEENEEYGEDPEEIK